jgi:hypothetical protein
MQVALSLVVLVKMASPGPAQALEVAPDMAEMSLRALRAGQTCPSGAVAAPGVSGCRTGPLPCCCEG